MALLLSCFGWVFWGRIWAVFVVWLQCWLGNASRLRELRDCLGRHLMSLTVALSRQQVQRSLRAAASAVSFVALLFQRLLRFGPDFLIWAWWGCELCRLGGKWVRSMP